jgi:hypothetical protein
MRSNASNYARSNAITTVDIDITRDARDVARQLLGSHATADRQRLGDELCDALCDAAAIDIVRLKVSDARQWHKTWNGRVVFKQYGYYVPKTRYVYVNNRTAVRGQVLAARTFTTTLLHEWVHHYDHAKLGLQSVHTAGFYARLRALREKLGV